MNFIVYQITKCCVQAHVLDHPELKRKLQRYGLKEWEEFGDALNPEIPNILKVPTERAEEEGSSNSISPSELKMTGNAVIKHLKNYRNAVYGAQVGASPVSLRSCSPLKCSHKVHLASPMAHWCKVQSGIAP